MAKEKDNIIRYPHLIICEGLDAKLFMMYYLNFLIKQDSRYEQFQAMNAGGVAELRQFIRMLPELPNFSMVKSVIIARDAENNACGANQSVQELLIANGFPVPSAPCIVARPMPESQNTITVQVKIGYILFPKLNSDETDGTLEDLCLQALANPNSNVVLNIVDNAIGAYQEQLNSFKRPHKNKLHTYLSLSDDFVSLKIGESAKANAFDYSASIFEPLSSLLAAMLQE